MDYITSQDKTYICEVTFGKKTDTYDKYGNITFEYQEKINLNVDDIKKVLFENFLGDIEQTPPAYSAIKINGKKAYDLARKGEDFEIPKRKVKIYDINLLDVYENKIMLKIKCSKGTYIRSICSDLGDILGYGAYMSFLLRTQTGIFDIDNAVMLSDINTENITNVMLTMDRVLQYPSLILNELETKRFINGVIIKKQFNNGYFKVYDNKNIFLGIGIIRNNNLKVEKLLL